MFSGCSVFTSDVSGWDVSQVWEMTKMFKDCREFNSKMWAVPRNCLAYEDMLWGCVKFKGCLQREDGTYIY
jgi:surface protein